MALPNTIKDALGKVNHAAEALNMAFKEVEAAHKYGDEDRKKKASDMVKKTTLDLADTAKILEEKARKVQ